MPPVFREHMVVQQGEPVIWYGKSNRGDTIDIFFDQQYRRIITSEKGEWFA